MSAIAEPPSVTAAPPSRAAAPPWTGAASEVAGWLRQAPRAALLEIMARLGFVARGVIYLSVGALALLAALDFAPKASGAVEAMAEWGRWPAGVALIWLTAVGLSFFTVWRAIQAGLDADGCGPTPRGLFCRGGQAFSGLVHATLAWSLAGLLDGLDDLNEADDVDAAQAAAQQVLAMAHGDLLLIVAGALVIAFAAGSVGQGLFQNFARRLGCSAIACRWAVALARVGYVGRGLALAPMGVFMITAGAQARASEARDFGGALQALEAQPFGSLALALAGLGLVAFGLFALFEAAWRRIEVPLRNGEASAALSRS